MCVWFFSLMFGSILFEVLHLNSMNFKQTNQQPITPLVSFQRYHLWGAASVSLSFIFIKILLTRQKKKKKKFNFYFCTERCGILNSNKFILFNFTYLNI